MASALANLRVGAAGGIVGALTAIVLSALARRRPGPRRTPRDLIAEGEEIAVALTALRNESDGGRLPLDSHLRKLVGGARMTALRRRGPKGSPAVLGGHE